MIWFACGECGKVHGRSEGSVGSMIFCGCGQGLTVPWESTAAEPELGPEPAGPVLIPVRIDEAEEKGGEKTRRLIVPPPLPERKPRRRGPRDPNACLNHEDRPKTGTCADCGEGFCISCRITFQGKTLCGPCKNLRVRAMARPPLVTGWAILSGGLALLAAAAILILFPKGQGWAGTILWTGVFLVPQALTGYFAYRALRRTETDAHACGDGLALFGGTLAAINVMVLFFLFLYGPRLG